MLLQEKMRQIKLAPAERSLIDYLLANPTAMADQTIKELSEKNLCSSFYFYSDRQKIRLQWLARLKNGLCGRANIYEQPFYRCGCELSLLFP